MHRVRFNITAFLRKNCYETVLALLTLGMFAVIEYKQHYFFLKADNLDQNLPYYVHNLRSVLAGDFPLFNFHQYLGTPVFSCIQSAALYPPTYLAALISRYVLGHFYGTMEVLAALHLVCAAIGFFKMMRCWGISKSSSLFGAIAWALCGFVIRVGDGWIQVVEYAALFPWILVYSLRLGGRFDLRSFVLITVVRTLALFVGNPPFFIYVVTFDILFNLLYFAVAQPTAIGDHNYREGSQAEKPPFAILLLRHVLSYCSVILISLPLLLPAFHQIAQSADRNSPLAWKSYSHAGANVILWVKGLLVPLSRQQYLLEGEQLFFSHIGWLTVLFAVASLCLNRSRWRLAAVFLSLAVFALLWADNTFLTKLIYYLPIYNRQRFPFKLLFFTSFFLIALSCIGHDFIYKKYFAVYRKRRLLSTTVLAVHVLGLLAFHLVTPYDNRRIKQVPYDEPLAGILADGRIVTMVDKNTDEQDKHPYLLGYNFATLFGLYHFAGYETLVSRTNLDAALGRNNSADFYVDNNSFAPMASDLDYFRRWGVKWYILDHKVRLQDNCCLKLYASDGRRSIAYDERARPLVYWEDSLAGGEIVYRFSANALNIATERGTPGRLVANILHHPLFEATIDGRSSKTIATADNQVAVQIPAGKHTVEIRYADHLFVVGLYISSGFITISSILFLIRSRRLKRDETLKSYQSGGVS